VREARRTGSTHLSNGSALPFRGRRAVVVAGLAAALTLGSTALLSAPRAAAADGFTPPPIGHVWVVNLENQTYTNTFGTPANNPYLASVLPSEGILVKQYYGVGHNSLDNYVAEVSGQAPNPQTQDDCGQYTDWVPPAAVTDLNGQAVGQGCVFPAGVLTLPDQLDPHHTDMAGRVWKGYMEDMGKDAAADNGIDCPHPALNGSASSNLSSDDYAMKHNPFLFFHSIIDNPAYCAAHDVPLDRLPDDLRSIATTPKFSFLVPTLTNTGHDAGNADQFRAMADTWLREFIPTILDSPAFRQDGLMVVTFDEADTVAGVATDTTAIQACCNEQPGPNSADPGVTGPGGGQVGTVLLSPFIKPGSVDDPASNVTNTGTGYYNHYSLLRSLEDLFHVTSGGSDGLGHLGFAGSSPTYPGPGSFGCDVYTGWAPCQAGGAVPATGSAAATPVAPGAAGPWAPDGSAKWLSPLPGGNGLRGVSCTAATCVVVGTAGTVLHTENRGATWTRASTGITAELDGVSCPTQARCLAVGRGGVVLVSDNAGVSWARRESPVSSDLAAVSCNTASLCLAAGAGGALMRSVDDGSTWAAVSSGVTQPLAGAACLPATSVATTTCFATGNWSTSSPTASALVSKDGGATWNALATQPGSIERLRAMSCAIPGGSTCVGVGDSGEIDRTTNQGGAWSAQKPFSSLSLMSVSCPAATACFAAGDGGQFQPGAVNAAMRGGAVLATVDGTTWKVQQTGTDDRLRGIDCWSATACMAVGERGTIITTHDGGTSWHAAGPGWDRAVVTVSCPPMMAPSCHPEARGALHGVSCVAGSHCAVVGTSGVLYGSADGGASWNAPAATGTHAAPDVAATALHAVSCPGAGSCIAVGDYGTVLRTAAGGMAAGAVLCTGSAAPAAHATASCPAHLPAAALYGVSCATEQACVAVGAAGTVLRTGDGGRTWSLGTSGISTTLDGVSCGDAQSCVAVGGLGTLLTSGDGGATWTARHSGTAAYLASVACPSVALCVAAGGRGTLLRSADGGVTWTSEASGVSADLLGVSCAGTSVCTAVGSEGAVMSSGDGGVTWSVEGTGTDRTLDAVACRSETSCIAAGELGAILDVHPAAAVAAVIGGVPLTQLPNTALVGAPAGAALAVVAALLAVPAWRRRARRRRRC